MSVHNHMLLLKPKTIIFYLVQIENENSTAPFSKLNYQIIFSSCEPKKNFLNFPFWGLLAKPLKQKTREKKGLLCDALFREKKNHKN